MKIRLAALCFIFMFFFWSIPEKAAASPWAEKESYGAKTGGKLVFGLKHTLFSWMNPWAEAHDPVYETRWTGFCAGIGKSVVYTTAGVIQLVTFPIPVDFPNVGLGMHIPANNLGVAAKGKKTADNQSSSLEAASEIPASNLDTTSEPKELLAPQSAEVQKTAPSAPAKIPASQPTTEPVQKTSAPQPPDKVIK